MANHADIGFRDPQEPGGLRGGLLVVKGHDDDRAFALLERLDTANQLIAVEARHRRLIRHEDPSELFQQLFLSARAAAQIEHGEGHEELLLHCTDDGVGIPEGNLLRVFEKGFSTKSKETNFGVGLHWCANAVGALGGRVWATSDGVGQGASMHVMVPLTSRDDLSITQAA